MPDLTYHAASGELKAYLARPDGQGPWPGVVVVMHALGLDDDIREQADRLAAGGYLAFAPDLYSGRGVRCVVSTLSASRSGEMSSRSASFVAARRHFVCHRCHEIVRIDERTIRAAAAALQGHLVLAGDKPRSPRR